MQGHQQKHMPCLSLLCAQPTVSYCHQSSQLYCTLALLFHCAWAECTTPPPPPLTDWSVVSAWVIVVCVGTVSGPPQTTAAWWSLIAADRQRGELSLEWEVEEEDLQTGWARMKQCFHVSFTYSHLIFSPLASYPDTQGTHWRPRPTWSAFPFSVSRQEAYPDKFCITLVKIGLKNCMVVFRKRSVILCYKWDANSSLWKVRCTLSSIVWNWHRAHCR